MPIVEFDGAIDLAQFWPTGSSDADTSKVVVRLAGGIRLRAASGARARRTTVYDGAFARVNGQRQPLIDERGQVIVRLQGVDAPELHARPRPMKGPDGANWSLAGLGLVKDYRQAQAETATLLLARHLSKQAAGAAGVKCRFASYLRAGEGPASVVDMFGRFVGSLRIGRSVLNHWLLRSGLALPALYSGMDLDNEIRPILAAWERGRSAGIAAHYSPLFGRFDPARLLRPRGEPQRERADFIHPKFFRRQVSWYAYRKAGHFKGGFGAFMRLSGEQAMLLADVLAGQDSARVYPLHAPQFMNERGLVVAPEQMVFKESPSGVYVERGGRAVPLREW
jgi:endonuclease YncB( thermonuclease family)